MLTKVLRKAIMMGPMSGLQGRQENPCSDPHESQADIHVHSKHSDRPSEWFLRRIGAPECFVEPTEVYRRARQRGMDFVTIADHNCIRGAWRLRDLPGVFTLLRGDNLFSRRRLQGPRAGRGHQ